MIRPFFLLLILFSLVACNSGERMLSTYLSTHQEQVNQPNSVDSRPVRFSIEPGTPARQIGKNLQTLGLIDDDLLFEAYVRVNGLAQRLQAGTFILSPSMTIVEIAEMLQRAEAASVTVTIPEGWRVEQVAAYLDSAEIFRNSVEPISYLERVTVGDLTDLDPSSYPFLQERPAGASLEGYLFPDTYQIDTENSRSADLLKRQLDNFRNQVVPHYKEAVIAGTTDLNLYTVLTVASIVEREAVVPEERPTIAGVYLNRLAIGMRLEADPTVQYAMGYQPNTGQWWKTPVFLSEYSSVDSPYNTYLYAGLPPGPIANPGLSSIRAVLGAESHPYLFFVALPNEGGRHVFAETFAEHLLNVEAYQNQ